MLLAKLFVSKEIYDAFYKGVDRLVLATTHGPLAIHLHASQLQALLDWVGEAYPELTVDAVQGGALLSIARKGSHI